MESQTTCNDDSQAKKIFSFKTFISNFNSSKKIKLIFASVLFIVILLIFASSFIPQKSITKSNIENTIIESKGFAYDTEQRLKNILSGIKGLDNVSVFVYVKSSEEVVYLKDSEIVKSSNNNETIKETTIFNKDGSSSSAVVVVRKYPEIEGVLIVASGADDVKLKLKIIDAISVVLSIAPTNIEVLEGKS